MNLFLNPLSPLLYGILLCLIIPFLEPYYTQLQKWLKKKVFYKERLYTGEIIQDVHFIHSDLDFVELRSMKVHDNKLLNDERYFENVVIPSILQDFEEHLKRNMVIRIRDKFGDDFYRHSAVEASVKIAVQKPKIKDERYVDRKY